MQARLWVGILLFFVYMLLHGVVKATPSLTPEAGGRCTVYALGQFTRGSKHYSGWLDALCAWGSWDP